MTSAIERRPDRSDAVVDTGLEYVPGDRVLVHVVHREQRISVSDDGAAVQRAARPGGWRAVADRIAAEFVVNISREGVVSLPVVRVGPEEEAIVRRIGESSQALYQELLDLRG
jgi:hypothetical protein